jgi:hypothetical protein
LKRKVEEETSKVVTGKSGAASSHQALFYNLISPHTIRRLAKRLTGGGIKYGIVQWRIGVNDETYVADRFNHLWEHLLQFMDTGNEHDDNLGGMLWAINALCEVERLSPESLSHVVGITNKFGEVARKFHEEEMKNRESK